jgi:hypothetical protein
MKKVSATAAFCRIEDATLCRSRRKVLPNCTAKRISNAPALAGSESILRLRHFEYNAHSLRLSQPVFLESNSAMPAMRRHFFRTAPDADKIWVCAQASQMFTKKRAAKHEALHRATIPLIWDDFNQPRLENRSVSKRSALRSIQAFPKSCKKHLDLLNQSVKKGYQAITGN